MVRKIVINECFGGFGLSEAAVLWLIDKGSPIVKKMPVSEYYGFSSASAYKHKDDAEKEWNKDWAGRRLCNGKHGLYKVGNVVECVTDGEFIYVMVDDDDSRKFRTHVDLITVVEILGTVANGPHAALKVVEIPDDVDDWYIDEYDGRESIREGRTWE